MRGPLFYPGTPAWRTRRDLFDEAVAAIVEDFTQRWPPVASIEFATEDIPPSDPAPWEDHSMVMARVFHADRRRGLADRIVVYRLPILRRAGNDYYELLREVLLERISHIIAIPPQVWED